MIGCRIYSGRVTHRRHEPVRHAFRARMIMLGIDLDHAAEVLEGTPWHGYRRSALVRFHRGDFFGDPRRSLAGEIRRVVSERSGWWPDGPVELVTQLRFAAWCFNPVSFYLCRDRSGAVRAVVAEITNTPWNERHAYVLGPEQNQGDDRHHRYRFGKAFHISPFSPMDRGYRWHFRFDRHGMAVHMRNVDPNTEAVSFEATLGLRARPATGGGLIRAAIRRPFAGLQTLVAIYVQALRLWLKRAPVHDHPTTIQQSDPDLRVQRDATSWSGSTPAVGSPS